MKGVRRIDRFVALALTVVCGMNSCDDGSCYEYGVTEVSIDSAPSALLPGTLLPLNLRDLYLYYFVDSFFVTQIRDENYYYRVYDKFTFDSIMSFGMLGRARNEFTSVPRNWSKQVYKRNGDNIIPLISVEGFCTEVNLNKTVKKGYTVVDSVRMSVSHMLGTSVFYGEDYSKQFANTKGQDHDVYVAEETLPKYYYMVNDEVKKQFTVFSHYPKNTTSSKVAPFLTGYLFKQPEGNIVIQPLNLMSYILFFDIEKENYRAIHIKGDRTFEDGIPEDEEEQTSMAFQEDVAVSKDFFFVLYWGDYEKMREVDPDYYGRLLQFDWSGNLLKSYIMHDWVNQFAYDDETKTLYGSNGFKGSFYSFGVVE